MKTTKLMLALLGLALLGTSVSFAADTTTGSTPSATDTATNKPPMTNQKKQKKSKKPKVAPAAKPVEQAK